MAELDESDELKICNNGQPVKLLKKLYSSKSDADISIKLTRSFPHKPLVAHKNILCAGSDFFRKELEKERADKGILPIDSVGIKTHEKMMFYMYTGEISLNRSSIVKSLKVLKLLKQYQAEELDTLIANQIEKILDMNNIFQVLTLLSSYSDCPEVKEACFHFLDLRAEEMVSNKQFYNLEKKTVIALLSRTTFTLSELDIFKLICEWRKRNVNEDKDGSLMNCVRFGWMTVKELVSEVYKENVIPADRLLRHVSESVGVTRKPHPSRSPKDVDVNVAALNTCKVSFGDVTELFYEGKSYSCFMNDLRGLTIELFNPFLINHIKFTLISGSSSFSNYKIHTSIDGIDFSELINYENYNCREEQNLYFEPLKVRYISIVITSCEDDMDHVQVSLFGCYYRHDVPMVFNTIVAPKTNVSLKDKGAVVLKGINGHYIINGDYVHYNALKGFTYHMIAPGESILIQLAQPYMISEMKMLLWDRDKRMYNYIIKTSSNNSDWDLVVDNTQSHTHWSSWQTLKFYPRITVYIEIVGTFCSAEPKFHVVHLECYAGKECVK